MHSTHTDNTPTSPTIIHLELDKCAGHGDHWALLTDDIAKDVPKWLQNCVESAIMPHGLHPAEADDGESFGLANQPHMLVSENEEAHINQILDLVDGKPNRLINAFPALNSQYGITAKIERIIACNENLDAVLRLKTSDGTVVYAFDQLYAINQDLYDAESEYFVNLSAWAYRIKPSDKDEVVIIEDQDAIRYHRAYNDIVANNNGTVPDDLQAQIDAWQPSDLDDLDKDKPLAPLEINMGNMCAYLFGETLGQEDDCWCQGQVIGKSSTYFNEIELILFDIVILREPDANPLVVRVASQSTQETKAIAVNDYIQANLWMQAAIYRENQR